MIAPLIAAGFTQVTMNAASTALTTTISTVVSEFFTHLYLYPGEHFMAICIMGVVFIGLTVGSAYLLKKVYDKYGPGRTREEG